ncbi:MAG: DUF3108 domain-containing protein [Paracoccaceae bacterium]
MRAILPVLAAVVLAAPAAAADPPGRLEGTWRLSIGGLTAAEAVVEGAAEGDGYAMRVTAGTEGFVARLFEAGIDARVEGAVEGGRLAPRRFRSRYHDSEKTRRVAMDYDADGAPAVAAEPAYDPKPWQLDPAAQAGLVDPLTALFAAFAPRPRGALCDATYRGFDARRAYAIVLGEPSGPSDSGTITCEAEYRRLAGFKDKDLAKPPFPFRVEFVADEGGFWRLDRALAASPVGTAVLARVGG